MCINCYLRGAEMKDIHCTAGKYGWSMIKKALQGCTFKFRCDDAKA
jgi:hypothetical protein